MNNFLKNLISKRQKMSTQFAWFTTLLIAIVSLLIAVSVLNFLVQIMTDIYERDKEADYATSRKVYEKIKNTVDTDKFKTTEGEIYTLLKDEVVGYVLMTNRHSNKITYSYDGKIKFDKKDLNYQNFAPMYVTDKYDIEIGFYEKKPLKDYVNVFLNKLTLLTFGSIFFGLLMAYFLFDIINRPIEELAQVAQKYKQGNFTMKLQHSSYEEINNLVDLYNSMGESLDELYKSLEMKVQERTVELEKAYKELQNTQAMMVHSEKMKSLGELVAGITHEINNPVNYIYGNLIHLQNYTTDLTSFINDLIKMANENPEELKNNIDSIKKKYDYDFIADDLPSLIRSCQEGATRTKNIIMDLKNFSRMGENVATTVDLPKEIDTTLNILHNKIKNRIVVHKDYQENLPQIDALGGQLNQVFMNILDNATYAIKNEGNIKIRMHSDEKYVTIEIEDDGCGIDSESAKKIFDPFFTTKPVGEGTGLGMSISYKVIKNHNGDIKVESEPGKGTKFTIKLPIQNKELTMGV